MSLSSGALADRFQLDRLAEELAERELSQVQSPNKQFFPPEIEHEGPHDLPLLLPLSHDNPFLTASSFDVEKFLLSRSYTSLSDLRSELRDYLSILKEELVKLINDDYEAFISLSTDLKGEGERLEAMKSPLLPIKAQVMVSTWFFLLAMDVLLRAHKSSKSQLHTIQEAIQEKLDKRTKLREEKVCTRLVFWDHLTEITRLYCICS